MGIIILILYIWWGFQGLNVKALSYFWSLYNSNPVLHLCKSILESSQKFQILKATWWTSELTQPENPKNLLPPVPFQFSLTVDDHISSILVPSLLPRNPSNARCKEITYFTRSSTLFPSTEVA